ncbi:hypothetical protein QCE62_15805 [Caballeronia sp. LZ033]|uniref:hypothetical protein n=1 Tax=Caballeronia sp. LZ033 TaxID=3038566 RepID=UPI00286555DA|nr:hypothetical protein [Caballeronia sp. LZ033]MDR5815045.1 hypothetical protein [Caballeronia sp. LZ033]
MAVDAAAVDGVTGFEVAAAVLLGVLLDVLPAMSAEAAALVLTALVMLADEAGVALEVAAMLDAVSPAVLPPPPPPPQAASSKLMVSVLASDAAFIATAR